MAKAMQPTVGKSLLALHTRKPAKQRLNYLIDEHTSYRIWLGTR